MIWVRPEVGAALMRCVECGGYEYGGAPDCRRCRFLVDALVEAEWQGFVDQWRDDTELDVARLIAAEPDQHDWRIVDGALDRIVCGDCGGRLSRGPIDCSPATSRMVSVTPHENPTGPASHRATNTRSASTFR